MAARTALKDIQIFNPYVNGNGSFNAYSYYDHGVETQENFRDVFPVTDQCERSAQLMGDDYVRLKFNLTAYVPMAAFSFIRYNGQTFFLMNDYCPHSNGSRKIYDGQGNAEVVSDSYEYDMKFYSVANMLRKPICYRHVKVAKGATAADGYHEWDEPEITVSATLPTMYVIIVQSIARYTTRLDSNLLLTQMLATIPTNGLDSTGIAPKNTVKLTADTELATFNFNGDNIADVCTTVANAYSDAKKETEWYIEEDANHSLTLHFCKCLDTQSMNHADDFSYKNTEGINRETHPVITGGLKKVDYSRDESNIPQVIIPYGSERNMTYQAVKGIDEVSQMQSTFGKRLRLKANHTCTVDGVTYPTAAMQAAGITGAYAVKDKDNNTVILGVDAHGGIANDQVNTGNEKVEYFDDVYPQCHFVVSKVEERSKKKDGNTIPEYTCEGIVVNSQGQEIQPEGDFYPLQIEEGKTLSVRFESGYLNGREFEIANKTQKKTNPSTGQPETNYTLRFVIVADGSIEDGTLIPSGNFKPRAREAGGYEGDKFALFNMKMPEAYITYAQEELAQKAYEKLMEYQDTVPDVKCTSDPDSFGGKDVYFGAQYTINSEKLGFTLNEQNRRVPVDFISRVVAYSYKLTKVDDVSFTLSSALVRGVLSEMEAAITNVSYATEGLGQRSINLSRRGWRDASEVADMITSMNTEMMLVGNEKYQFGYTSEILPLHTNGVFTGLKVSYGQLQHTQQPYIDYANGGLWQIQPEASLNADYQGNALDGTKPYYVFAVCGTDNLEWATVILMDKDAAETNGVYHKDAEISDQDQYPQYLLLGILSSEFAEEKNGQMTYERVFSPTCGFTAIEGGTITTEQIQDANRQLIIDFLSKPPRIIAVNGAEVFGNIRFKSMLTEDGKNAGEEIFKEIGGENLYSGVDPCQIITSTKDTDIVLENGKKYVISIAAIDGNAYGLLAKEKIGSAYSDLGWMVKDGTIGTMQHYKNKTLVVTGHGGKLALQVTSSGADYYYTLTGIMVQQGEKPTAYHAGYLAKALERDATKEVTSIDGGLLLSALIKLVQGGVVRAGMSGLADYGQKTIDGQTYQSEGVGFWAGADYEDALAAACGIETNTLPPVFLSKTGYKSRIGCFRVVNRNTIAVVTDQSTIYVTNDSISNTVTVEETHVEECLSSYKSLDGTGSNSGEVFASKSFVISGGKYAIKVPAYTIDASAYSSTRPINGAYARVEGSFTLHMEIRHSNGTVIYSSDDKYCGISANCYNPNESNNATDSKTMPAVELPDVELPAGTVIIEIKGVYDLSIDGQNMLSNHISFQGHAVTASIINMDKFVVLAKDGIGIIANAMSTFYVYTDSTDMLKVIAKGLPSSNPNVAGQLYTQNVNINGTTQKIVCVSTGSV